MCYHLQGTGGCQTDGDERAEVIVYMKDRNDHTVYIIEKLAVASYTVSYQLKFDEYVFRYLLVVYSYKANTLHMVFKLDGVKTTMTI